MRCFDDASQSVRAALLIPQPLRGYVDVVVVKLPIIFAPMFDVGQHRISNFSIASNQFINRGHGLSPPAPLTRPCMTRSRGLHRAATRDSIHKKAPPNRARLIRLLDEAFDMAMEALARSAPARFIEAL